MAAIPHYDVMEEPEPGPAEDRHWDELPRPPSRLRIILSRAAVVYLSLFLGISLLLSVLGIDPLIQGGLIPQCLLVYVGFMALIALANGDDENLINEQVRSRLALVTFWTRRRQKNILD